MVVFFINSDFSPAYLYELAKMDGAIILSEDGKRILYANTQLVPNNNITSSETGIRHRSAERVAKQTGNLTISISQRRNVITLYQGEHRYALKDIGVILTKANQAIQTLEKYRAVLDQSITNLGAMEFEQLVTYSDVVQVIHRIQMVLRIKQEIQNFILELGDEGRLITMQLKELVSNTEQEATHLLKDYSKDRHQDVTKTLADLTSLLNEDLLDEQAIIKALGFGRATNILDQAASPRGYRILHRIPRLPSQIIENVINEYGHLSSVMVATVEQLDEVDGIGEARAKMIKNGLSRIQEQLFVDRHI